MNDLVLFLVILASVVAGFLLGVVTERLSE